MTMIATKDSDHICRLDAYRIANKCKLDELVVLDILKLLASPDTRRQLKQEFDGRRIKAVEDGWLVLNGEKYRKMVSDEMKKARNRKSQAAWRKRKQENNISLGSGGSNRLRGEDAVQNAIKLGATESETDKMTGDFLPKHLQ